jgi:hypothetical protein
LIKKFNREIPKRPEDIDKLLADLSEASEDPLLGIDEI